MKKCDDVKKLEKSLSAFSMKIHIQQKKRKIFRHHFVIKPWQFLIYSAFDLRGKKVAFLSRSLNASQEKILISHALIFIHKTKKTRKKMKRKRQKERAKALSVLFCYRKKKNESTSGRYT